MKYFSYRDTTKFVYLGEFEDIEYAWEESDRRDWDDPSVIETDWVFDEQTLWDLVQAAIAALREGA